MVVFKDVRCDVGQFVVVFKDVRCDVGQFVVVFKYVRCDVCGRVRVLGVMLDRL